MSDGYSLLRWSPSPQLFPEQMALARPLQIRADCQANFNLIRSWISQCERHLLCTKGRDTATKAQLPTRLIDVTPGSESGAPRLVLTADLEDLSDCRYIALSHCWGRQGNVPKTLRATLFQHQNEITGLSKTFEDAIEATREIGLRYIWIDSLCIIQDEESDFQEECSRMSLIYARCYCMLAAEDAEDGSAGLFLPRASRTPQVPENPLLSWPSLLHGPLSTRGWAFQEYQLSPRVVHYTRTRILWQCRVCVAFEDFPDQIWRGFLTESTLLQQINQGWSSKRRAATWRLLDGKVEREEPQSLRAFNAINSQTVHTRWLEAVELYSARNLTYEIDRLPAISGLAAVVGALLEDDVYLGGIWKKDLLRGLMWTPISPATGISPSDPPRRVKNIPSWSWASFPGVVRFLVSLDGGRNYGRPHENRLALLLENAFRMPAELRARPSLELKANTYPSGLDPFGAISGGSLTISGLTRTFDIGIPPGCSECLTFDRDTFSFLRCVHITLDDKSSKTHLNVVYAIIGTTGPNSFGLILQRSGRYPFQRLGIFYHEAEDYRFRSHDHAFEDRTITVV